MSPAIWGGLLHHPLMPNLHTVPFALSAWIDESVIVGDENLPGVYILASVIADPAAVNDLRDALRGLKEKKIVRLHWFAESAKRRDRIAHAISELDVVAIVALGRPLHRQKQERARRRCLECLLYELEGFGVTQVWLESRTKSQDQLDRRLVDSARDKGLISRQLSVDFGQPVQEPMLWLPDAVAGAVSADQRGESRWLLTLSELVDLRDVDVR
jgi:hypothetical protein